MHFEFGYSEEERLGKPYDLGLLKRLYPYLAGYRLHITASVLLILLLTLSELAIPLITKAAIDLYIVPEKGITAGLRNPGVPRVKDLWIDLTGKNKRPAGTDERIAGVTKMTGLFLLVIFSSLVFNYLQILMMEYTGQMVMHGLRMDLFSRILEMPVTFFNRNPLGRLVTRVTNDVQNMNELFTSVIVFVFKDLFLLAGIAIVLVGIDARLAIISFSVIPFVLLASLRFAARAREAFRDLRMRLAEINTRFSETIAGISVIQLFLHEEENLSRFSSANHENYVAGMRQIHLFAIFMPFIEFLSSAAIAVIIYYGGGRVIDERISLGALVAFISYMRMFFRPIRDIAEKYNIMQNAMASAERIFQILDQKKKPSGFTPGTGMDEIRSISFENVGFEYNPNEPVLKDISFSVESGRTIAFVGPTGSGKTTLINLLIRFYEPTSGIIRINGRNIKEIPARELRKKTALVTQDPFLFTDTIYNNIFTAAANRRISPREVDRVISRAGLKEMLAGLPGGMNSMVLEGGRSLSSGQRQVISIARAFARNPELIILDEATSYVDSETERVVQEAMAGLMKGRTTIIIAHRLSTAKKADRIYVLFRGRITEAGTHRFLIGKDGLYRRLYLLQQAEKTAI